METIEKRSDMGFQWNRKTGWIVLISFILVYGCATLIFSLVDLAHASPFMLSMVSLMTNFGAVVICLVAGRLAQKINLKDLGFVKTSAKWIVLAAVLGLVMLFVRGLFAQLLFLLFPSLNEGAEVIQDILVNNMAVPWQQGLMLLMGGIIVPIGEELFFRSFLQRWIGQKTKPWLAVLLSAVLFAAFHIIPIQVIIVFPVAIVLAWIYKKSGSLIPAIVLHAVNNLVALAISFIALNLA